MNAEERDLFQRMLEDEDDRINPILDKTEEKKKIEKQTSEKGANLEDFIQMLSKIISHTLTPEQGVIFLPDEGKRIHVDPTEELDNPHISYIVVSRKPTELKPRLREDNILDEGDPENKRQGLVYGQRFECIVQFNIFSSEYSVANQVMYSLEDTIFAYTGYFKKHGVGELYFHEHMTDTSYDVYRQKMSVRNIRYKVTVEKTMSEFNDDVEFILT